MTAVELLRQGCIHDDRESCHDLAVLYLDDPRVPVDPERSMELLSENCDEGYVPSCVTRAGILAETDPVEGFQAYLWLCQREGFADACVHASDMIAIGQGVEVDQTRGWALMRRACDLGHPDACDRRQLGPGNR